MKCFIILIIIRRDREKLQLPGSARGSTKIWKQTQPGTPEMIFHLRYINEQQSIKLRGCQLEYTVDLFEKECYFTVHSYPTRLSFLHSLATLGNGSCRRSVCVPVGRGRVAVPPLFSAKFKKASYAKSGSLLICHISAVELQQNVTGRCQEILQSPCTASPWVQTRQAGQGKRNSIFFCFFFTDDIMLFFEKLDFWETK